MVLVVGMVKLCKPEVPGFAVGAIPWKPEYLVGGGIRRRWPFQLIATVVLVALLSIMYGCVGLPLSWISRAGCGSRATLRSACCRYRGRVLGGAERGDHAT